MTAVADLAERRVHSTHEGFRPDVEGLRALAVIAVLLYHAGLSSFGGGYVGVDVFFVISGYLITGLLLRELEDGGRVSLRRFYARRAKRLLPSLALVLLTVGVLAWFLFPPVRRVSTYGDVGAAALYVSNWRLAHSAVDYSAAGQLPSPVQHIWSLAVEEQFYMAWPLLMVVATSWRRRRGRAVRSPLLLVLCAVTLGSLVYCGYMTAAQAGTAYFSTFTRGWELGLGGVLAIVLMRWPAPSAPWRPALSLVGLGAIVAAVLCFDDDTAFPGLGALLPTLGTAAVIAAGTDGPTGHGLHRLLAGRAIRHVGRISYTWYLWHWPLLVFAAALWGRLQPGVGLLVAAASYLPTLLTHRLVEEPLRRRASFAHPGPALCLGLACTGVVTVVAVTLRMATPMVATASHTDAVGARALRDPAGLQTSATAVRPAPQNAAGDRGRLAEDGCLVRKLQTHSPTCEFGDTASSTTVVLFGDSHAMQWFPALIQVAEHRHWKLVVLTKAGCPSSNVQVFDPGLRRAYTECNQWRRHTLQRIRHLHPNLVVTSSLTDYPAMTGDKRLSHDQSVTHLRRGFRPVLTQLDHVVRRLVVIEDVPHHRNNVPDCVAAHPQHLDACAIPRREAVDSTPLAHTARSLAGARLVDPVPELCPDRICPGVIGNVLIYRNAGHLTATYVRTLGSWLDYELPPAPRGPR